jgi:hypothetical protein
MGKKPSAVPHWGRHRVTFRSKRETVKNIGVPRLVELADTHDSGSCACNGLGSSTLPARTEKRV